MANWYERAEQEINEDYERGDIDLAQYQSRMRDLNAELREEARNNAEQAYNDTMGGW